MSVGPAHELKREEAGLLACVHCGFCLSACPTYTRLGHEGDSPRGRLDLMRAVVEGRLDADDPAFGLHIDQCLGCRACEPVCPSGVPYGFLLERARAAIAESTGVSLSTRLIIAAYTGPMSPVVTLVSRLFRATRLPRLLAAVLPVRFFGSARFGLAMLAASAPWPPLRSAPGAAGPAPAVDRARPAPPGRETSATDSHARAASRPVFAAAPRTAILTGCVQESLFARVNRATERVLTVNGCAPLAVPGQRCCGALHAHAGLLESARDLARANIAAFDEAGAEAVVINAAGCSAMMKEYGEQLRDDPVWADRAHDFAGRVKDLSEFLVERGVRTGGAVRLRVTYDAPCHLHHGQRIREAPLRLLDAVPGLVRVLLPDSDECCGGAGLYGVHHPELGGRILADKVAAIRSTGADAVLTPNPGCMMQIGAGLLLEGESARVLHPVEVLDESYRRAGEEGES